MPQKTKAKIISLFRRSKPVENPIEENSVLAELKAAIAATEPLETPVRQQEQSMMPSSEAAAPAAQTPSTVTFNIAIHGGASQISTGGTIHNTINPNSLAASSDAVNPGKPVINIGQKRQLRDLRDEIVAISTECNMPKHPATIMVGLNSYMKVSKYDQIFEEDFEKARNRLLVLRETLTGFRSALQIRQDLRSQMINTIQSHYEEMGQKSALSPSLALKFKEDPNLDLPTTQLEEIYRAVISEK